MEFKEKLPLYKLKEIASILRSKNGCAWDREQTSKTLRPYLIEETYEVYDAIENEDIDELKEELGDLLYQVYAHSQIHSESDTFDIDDVAEGITEKLIRRHPHVFDGVNLATSDEISDRWEKIKKEEKSHRESILEGVPKNLPALLKAYRVQQKVSRYGFDWEKIDDAVVKLDEEINELKDVINSHKKINEDELIEESGDVLFSIVNILRFLKINPEEALSKTITKFITRFKYIEKKVEEENKNIEDMSLKEMDIIWEEAKKNLENK